MYKNIKSGIDMDFNMMRYSNEFKKLIEDKKKTKFLIEGSHLSSIEFEEWKNNRFSITKAINKDGRILDIGCANGFLLRCLQEWSNHKLEPYGIDIDQELIKEAKKLFPSQAKNFIVKELKDFLKNLAELSKHGFPAKYDFIYWNVWDNRKFENQKEVDIFKTVLELISDGGRLILGFYNLEKGREKIKKLKELGFKFSGIVENLGDCENGIIAWIDKFITQDK